ncbi:uncharacterized protein [Anabrus simplex]|uniref:uncharacterized protein n=1 Tax=Anabrus simplex TaxID=316456 RepID=UPI0035A2F622
MDQKVEIKEEPVWLDGTEGVSFAVADIKDEINIEEQTLAQLVPCFKEENNFENVSLLIRGPGDTCDSSCKVMKSGGKLMRTLPPQNVLNQHTFSPSAERQVDLISKQEFSCDQCGNSTIDTTEAVESRKGVIRQYKHNTSGA